jgi:hypothetical protein
MLLPAIFLVRSGADYCGLLRITRSPRHASRDTPLREGGENLAGACNLSTANPSDK